MDRMQVAIIFFIGFGVGVGWQIIASKLLEMDKEYKEDGSVFK